MVELNIGDKAPDFSLINQDNEVVTLDSLKGKKIIIFFYPKDNTPGCTAEACNLRDNYEDFKKAGYTLLGVSPDSAKKHQNFIAKHELPFDLLVDDEQKMLNDFGAWGLKKFMGKEYMGVLRSTFVIDEDQKISHIIKKVKTKAHSEQLKEALGM